MHHIVLLGDSIFDNGIYVPGGPDVISQLKNKLPQGWKATLKALDGSTINDVKTQLEELPEDASFLVVSTGGNDALSHIELFNEPAGSFAEVLLRLADIQEAFRSYYHEMLKSVLACGSPTAICTIYYPRFSDILIQKMAVVTLSIFNDSIVLEAIRNRIQLIDLRLICNELRDYSNPIEPSVSGGEKITNAILNKVKEFDASKPK